MSDLGLNKSALERKVAGIPVWALSAVIAGIAYFIYKRRANAAAAAAVTSSATAVDSGTGTVDSSNIDPNTGVPYDQESNNGFNPNTAIDSYLAGNPGSTAYPVGSVSNGVPGPITNEQWARLGADKELSNGADPSLVSNALSKYLAGGTLSSAEQAIVNTVLIAFGTPPQGVMPVITTPPPTGGGTKTTPPPTTSIFANKTVAVSQTSNLWGLATEQYPNATAKQLEQIVFNTVKAQPQYGNNSVPAQHRVTFYAAGVH